MKNKIGKRVKFWFWEGISEETKYESTGTVVAHIPEENCLTVRDDADHCDYYIGIDQCQEIKEDCKFYSRMLKSCEFPGTKEDRNCEDCLEYDSLKDASLYNSLMKLAKEQGISNIEHVLDMVKTDIQLEKNDPDEKAQQDEIDADEQAARKEEEINRS